MHSWFIMILLDAVEPAYVKMQSLNIIWCLNEAAVLNANTIGFGLEIRKCFLITHPDLLKVSEHRQEMPQRHAAAHRTTPRGR